MFPCCGYDPGLAAYLGSVECSDANGVGDDRLDGALCATSVSVVGLCWGLLFLVTLWTAI